MSDIENYRLIEEIPSASESEVDPDSEADDNFENLNFIGDLHDANDSSIPPVGAYIAITPTSVDSSSDSEDEIPLLQLRKILSFDTDKNRTNSVNNFPKFTKYSGSKNILEDAETPFDIFLHLFPLKLIFHIKEQTNLYALQKYEDLFKFKKTTDEEIKVFLSINVLMGIKWLSTVKDYWSSNEEI